MNNITIKQANENDIPVIEEILLDAVNWLESTNQPLWNAEQVKWERLSKQFSPDNFYIAYIDNCLAGCMALVDHDPFFWPDITKGESLFIHKLAVKRFAAGHEISTMLLQHAVNKCREKSIKTLRLDTDGNRKKVVKVYENFGFVIVDERTIYINSIPYFISFMIYAIAKNTL
jgi:N-acetylglutamate synthase-like GNAT family acetyltransferase